ncbi:LysR family transcriptional regulator [Streptomyces sp. NBC_01198]|uniref:LysR family transcriptional regulator n=1 Tax=Streptomyces sp. NBC_01198 TaxID=2903769 RepID=UPI002E0F7467|nr:LysR family transcriptional regulator [Streptomyces sp. NBC_01198]
MALREELSGIEFRHLRYFAAVADAGTVTAAARRLRIAQPSLSQQIRALERRVGVPLFDRSPKGMALTEAGWTLLAAGRRAEEELRTSLADIRGAVPTVRVGVCAGVPQSVLAAAEQLLTRERPLQPAYQSLESHRQAELLSSGRLDFGILRPPIDDQRLVMRILSDEPLGVVLSCDHPLAAHTELTWSDLAQQGLLWFPHTRAPDYAATVLTELATNGWRPATVPAEPNHTLFRHALLGGDHLVALRPRAAVAADTALAWLPVGPNPPRERLVLAAAAAPWTRLLG